MLNTFQLLTTTTYNFFTTFPQKLWKTSGTSFLFRGCAFFLCLLMVTSCTYFRGSKQDAKKPDPRILDNAVISMTEEEVRKRFGEPNVVSKTPENHILWTYRPSWRIMPDNAETIYVEFDDGKVIRILKVK